MTTLPNYNPLSSLDILEAAETLHVFFEKQGIREWEFSHVADRRLVDKLERENHELLSALERIEDRYCDGENTFNDWKAMGEIARETLNKLNGEPQL